MKPKEEIIEEFTTAITCVCGYSHTEINQTVKVTTYFTRGAKKGAVKDVKTDYRTLNTGVRFATLAIERGFTLNLKYVKPGRTGDDEYSDYEESTLSHLLVCPECGTVKVPVTQTV